MFVQRAHPRYVYLAVGAVLELFHRPRLRPFLFVWPLAMGPIISPGCEGTDEGTHEGTTDRINNASIDANVTPNHETTDKTTDYKEPEAIDNQIVNTNAYPTDARERQNIHEKYAKAKGIVRNKTKKSKFIEDKNDDCGEDLSSIVPDLDKYYKHDT